MKETEGIYLSKTMRNRRNSGQEHGNHSCEDGWLLLWREAGSEKVYDQIATGKKPIYTYGPIIHNEEVVRDLEEKGVQVIHSKEELEALKEAWSSSVPTA